MVISNRYEPQYDKLHPYYQLYTLLNTERGTVPLKRGMGLDPRMIDKPITIIQGGIEADIQGQIDKYINGLRLVGVRVTPTSNGLEIICEVELDG